MVTAKLEFPAATTVIGAVVTPPERIADVVHMGSALEGLATIREFAVMLFRVGLWQSC